MYHTSRHDLTAGKLVFLTVMGMFAFFGVMLQGNPVLPTNTQSSSSIKIEKVVVDAGHGGLDGGATGIHGEVEKEINLAIAGYLKGFLRLSGIEVVMTRESDVSLHTSENASISQKKAEDIRKRLTMIDGTENTVAVSIHQNQFSQSKYHGAQMFFGVNHPQSEVLAQTIQTSIVEKLQPDNQRQIKKGTKSVYLLMHAQNPIVLVECGFLSNDEEAKKLSDETYQKDMAFAIYCGLMEYCGKTPIDPSQIEKESVSTVQ